MNTKLRRIAIAAASSAIMAGGMASPAWAQPWTYTYQDAQAVCAFPLVVSGSGESLQKTREFTDRDGHLVATLSAGTGQELTFTNGVTGASFSTAANGSVSRTRLNADGSSTTTMTGHNAILLFPSDVGGPSAKLYAGSVTFSVSLGGVWEVIKYGGDVLDICAVLSEE